MSYRIECVVREIQCDGAGSVSGIKIKGTEGYLLKQGDSEYNVFSPDAMPQKGGSGENVFVLHAETELNISGDLGKDLFAVLLQAKCADKKVKLKIDANKGKKREGIDPTVKLESISVL